MLELTTPHWQDRPDKAGYYWLSPLFEEYAQPHIIEIIEMELSEGKALFAWDEQQQILLSDFMNQWPHSKWCYIEQPEPPKE